MQGAHQPLNLFKLFMKIIYVEFEFARFLGRFLIALAPQQQWSRRLVDSLCWVGDLVLGMVLLLGLFLGSLFGLLTRLQAAVLFSMAFSNSYMANENLKHSELGRLAKELKDLLYTNQQLLAQTGKARCVCVCESERAMCILIIKVANRTGAYVCRHEHGL